MSDDFDEALKSVDPDKNYFEELARILAEKKNVKKIDEKNSYRRKV